MSEQQATRKKRVIVSGAEYWDFDENTTFIGTWTGREMKREKDGKEDNQKKGDVIGFYFVDENGQEWVISNSHQIKKAVEQVEEGDKLEIIFKGKTENASGKPVNRYEISVIEED
jgi:hypothetical protein